MDAKFIYLTQSDTTAGLLSADPFRLNQIKGRQPYKPILAEVDCYETLKKFTRVPVLFRNRVRRSQKTTFIYPNHQSFRVVKDESHLMFLRKFSIMYSSSANKTGSVFDIQEAIKMCDIIVIDSRGIFAGIPSKIFKINKIKIKKIR
ncbi:Sua5 YciO YrdC YwlC family protein [Helicobacter sp. 11S03491-1]|uniref:Sua5 YciO YrdC YwlC family protein n=1 Tax=Helicobacter sp. 11S03491-1 TaxID=1476196 RepID=UPI000BA61A5C|nr:Sua5 YciO YrdC YwlC family protein [Helicobacter sp. 11S03491-1]PAF42063.1 Sua5 YciO YrdC YwlC family protein [Helicobacter sp. 11S03491-1]